MLSEIYYKNENSKQLQTQNDCQKKSYWKFVKENETLKQSQFTAKGENCENFISTDYGVASIKENFLNYFVNDVHYSMKIDIISPNKFSLTTQDLIGGKMVSIEKIYRKK